MILRAAKASLVFGVAVFYTILVFNNLTDYDSNYQFVRHVLMMIQLSPTITACGAHSTRLHAIPHSISRLSPGNLSPWFFAGGEQRGWRKLFAERRRSFARLQLWRSPRLLPAS